LAVDGGTISLGYGSNAGLLKLLDDSSLGTLILGGAASGTTNVLKGLAAGTSGGTSLTGVGTDGVTDRTYGNNDLTIAGAAASGTGGNVGTSALVTLANGIITITPTAGGNTITSSSGLIRLP
jgi:hypothetical protein